MPAIPIDLNEIVITASRAPEEAGQTPASVTLIDATRIERLGEPLLSPLLRLTPSAAVTISGPAGSLTEVRIRGAEANHSLLFIDGIRANDPAAGNIPRFELLNADIASRIEVVRGPQSALWGSEAIGGVIAVNGGAEPVPTGVTALAEAGSFGFRRASASGSIASAKANLAAAIGWQSADGIDVFGGVDRDGYRNLSARVRGYWTPQAGFGAGVAAFHLDGKSEFDGNDPVTFARTHLLDSDYALSAGRVWADFGQRGGVWSGIVAASLLASSNRNFFAGEAINRTEGKRATIGAQVERRLTTGPVTHLLIAALDHEGEQFTARDTVYGGATAQDRSRAHQSLTVEWRAEAGPLASNVALRRDAFNRFKAATTLRASLLARLGKGFAMAGSYGEGIAQPTFFDLYGFFPGSFQGNPSLKTESSRGGEVSLRFRGKRVQAALTGYRQRLRDEIVDVFDPATFLSSTVNRNRASRRSGIEVEVDWAVGTSVRLTTNYAFLKASQPASAGAAQVREVRRPKHSGSLALDGVRGRLTYGASLTYTGARGDTAFDVPPFGPVRLSSYWLAGARLGFAVRPGVELFARAANAFDERYQDVFSYRTEGRSLYAGIRFTPRR